jgi:hypothetical protein
MHCDRRAGDGWLVQSRMRRGRHAKRRTGDTQHLISGSEVKELTGCRKLRCARGGEAESTVMMIYYFALEKSPQIEEIKLLHPTVFC